MVDKTKKRAIIVVVMIIIIALLGTGTVFAYNYISDLKSKSNGSGLKVESNIYMDDESASQGLEDNVSSINVNMRKTLKLTQNSEGKMTLQLGLNNGNAHQYIVGISVGDTTICTTNLIPAGAQLEEIQVDNVDLDAGTYEAIAIFSVISEKDNRTVLGTTGLAVPLEVIK